MIGKQIKDYLYGKDESNYVTAPYTSDPNTGTEYSESWQRRRDGQKRLLAVWRRPVKNNLGKLVGFLSASQDIAVSYRAEQENQQLGNKTETLSRLATLGEMAAGIAHEINNPLTGIIGYSELLVDDPDVPDKVKEDVKRINAGSQRVKDIVRRMLTFARQQKPQQTVTNVNELLENTISMREYVLRTANIAIIRDFDGELPYFKADSGQLQQVFLNILVNAEQAMKTAHHGGTLVVSTRQVAESVRIIFKDDGPRMNREVKAKLFQPFFTTKPPGEGTGLGLSMSHFIITEHGGTI
jgi:signal transduction histidine kinase